MSALEAVRVVRDPATSIGKGFAFALFRTKVGVEEGGDRGGGGGCKRGEGVGGAYKQHQHTNLV